MCIKKSGNEWAFPDSYTATGSVNWSLTDRHYTTGGDFFISLKLTVFSQRFFEFCLLFICQPWKEALRWYLLCISYKNLASNFVSWILAINALCRTFSSALYNRSWIVCLWWVFFFVISQFDRLAQLHLKYQCIRRSTSFTNSQFHIAVGFRSFIMGGGSIFD